MRVASLLDASAILAFLWAEPGSDQVAQAFARGTVGCTVANWSEVVAKVVARRRDWSLAESALIGKGLGIVPIETVDAVEAGRMWATHPALSLGDRLCLSVGQRLGATILTADRQWRDLSPLVVLIR
ncbi:MAG: PIN domain-containing protein [Micrococcales bacterium]|nr:PIN domain-containing protein [Micrococcales bacterium]